MSCPPNTIYYCSISAGAKILATFSCGDQETDMWAALCLENIPPLHAWYFQRFRNRFFAFLMEDRHVFFVIADESLGKTGVFDFLGCVRENFRRVIQSGAKGSNRLTSFCLRDALRPVLMRLVHNINGSPNLTQGNMGDMGVVIESYPSGPLTKSSSMETSGQQIAQRTWCRHLWIALAIDLMLCLILFGIWLGVCGSFTCLSS